MATDLKVVKSQATPIEHLVGDYLAEVQAKGHSRKTRDLYEKTDREDKATDPDPNNF